LLSTYRRPAKKSWSSAELASASIPPTTSQRWFSRSS